MSQWGRNDQAVTANSTTTTETSNGAPTGTYALVKAGGGANAHFGNTSAGSRAATDVNMFQNTTISAFIPGAAVGLYGVDATEMSFTTGSTNGVYRVTSGGSGYGANAVVTLTFANGVSNVSAANSTANTTGNAGRITALTSNVTITNITTIPVLTIAAPAAINIVANNSATGFSNTADTIIVATANSRFQVGDRVFYTVPTANTPIAPLTGNTFFFVSFANTTTIKLATTATGANIDITDARTTATGEVHTIQGDTATGLLEPSGAKQGGVPHAGWVLRTEGTGGRAGRVQYEVLVAMGSLGAQSAGFGTPALVADGADDSVLHDS